MRRAIVGLWLGLAACAHRPAAPAEDVFAAAHARCDAGDVTACVRLGAELQGAESWRKGATVESFGAYEQACGLGEPNSCRRIAAFYDVGCCGAPRKDEAHGATLLERACDLRSVQACDELALRYRTTMHGPKDPAKARRADERGCELGNETQCTYLLTGLLAEETPDWPAIDRALGQLACPDSATPCDNLRGARLFGWYGKKDEAPARKAARDEHARELVARGCEQGEPHACLNFAGVLREGLGGARDATRALQLYDRECEAGAPEGCWGAAGLRAMEPSVRDLKAARAGFDRACGQLQDADSRRDCQVGAAEVLAAAGAKEMAAELFRPWCEQGDQLTCVRWGRTLAEDRRGHRQAVELFRKACDAREPRGCARLARMMALGRGVKKDAAAADALAKQACADGATEACTLRQNLAELARPLGKLFITTARLVGRPIAAVLLFPHWQLMVGDWW
ncbi:tetratricopeptide repeat protein [Nannocystis sp. SCPEA4]|uniref:tetratricopeptide repeat protein n=1 Tax=Nannocystis sp. SCPEA4 TaxID=2996787 RepID=UPI002271DCA5|nr:tetratricopeptide repeat protein [Nannocystis sp. SCPEA4]MCY1062211.1 tetratricopeptide repeat protein [Nannocystis sp. SCPEA4]